jgi:hypothetical protein
MSSFRSYLKLVFYSNFFILFALAESDTRQMSDDKYRHTD